MQLTSVWIIALAGLTAAGLVAWTWRTAARAMDELRAFDSFKGMHFEE